MKLKECIKRIEKYLVSNDTTPRLVNVQNRNDLLEIVHHFKVGNNIFLAISDYAKEDENPKIDVLQNDLESKSGDLFITGLTTQMKLFGEQALTKELQNFVSQTFIGHVVVICYQCKNYLYFTDSRANRLVYSVEGSLDVLSEVIFILPELPVPSGAVSINGVQEISTALETVETKKVYVKTNKHKSNYPESLFYIKEESNAFDILCNLDTATQILKFNFGTDEQWLYALKEVSKAGSWRDLINQHFNLSSSLNPITSSWSSFDSKKQWLYFIALKLNYVGKNRYLNKAVENADRATNLIPCIYKSILSIEPSSPDYWEIYNERKQLIVLFSGSNQEILDYIQMVKSREFNALYYLTDITRIEKELIFELLDKYALQYSKNDILQILSYIYPDLYAYLQPYQFRNKQMYKYFQDYKYQKVINKILPEFLVTVEEQAKKRDFNLWLPPRSEKVESLNKDGAFLYFIDSMGVEYLSFILNKCKSKGLMANISLCRCELPSITKLNKEFIEPFRNNMKDFKQLDNIKHHGEESFNYQQTKFPIHLIRELEIIDNILTDIQNRLGSASIERAYIISDHGSSRLAVIQESECQWEMSSKGKHSGRCCPVKETDVKSEYATESNNFWVLANYDRFKGSRKANVEVHGGATLEEVTIPIIEFTYIYDKIEVSINTKLPIEISFRKQAELQLFSKTKLAGATVCIRGKKFDNHYYDTEPKENNLYLVKMPDLKVAGTYQMAVFLNNNQIAELEFMVKKEGASERSIL